MFCFKKTLLHGLLLAAMAVMPAVGFASTSQTTTEPVLAQATPRVEKAWGGWRGGYGWRGGGGGFYGRGHYGYPYRYYNYYPYSYYNYYNYPYYRPYYRHYYNWW